MSGGLLRYESLPGRWTGLRNKYETLLHLRFLSPFTLEVSQSSEVFELV